MKPSSLSDQVVYRKKGRIVSPLVDGVGDRLILNSWSIERVPEYIWLALILDKYGRTDGLYRCIEIIKFFHDCISVKISDLLSKDNEIQKEMYNKITSIIEPEVLSPLTVVIDECISETFFVHFFAPEYTLVDRVEKLRVVTQKYFSPDSHEATDLRYLAILPQFFSGSIVLENSQVGIHAFTDYIKLDHDEQIMKFIRPFIRSLEGIQLPDDHISEFVGKFWNKVMNLTDCNPMGIVYKPENDKEKYLKFIENTKEALNYLNAKFKPETVIDDSYSVLLGSLIYAFKTFIEVIEHDLGNTIIGRQSVRIIIEVYIMMKYLCLKEIEKPLIWKEYKAYGIGKYKLILLKIREGMSDGISHASEDLINAVVNERLLEEFTEVDLRYFDDVKIRDKAICVNEKGLYDVAYDYDSSFAHGLWGAVRESSMLSCNNVFHHYHCLPDAYANQNLANISEDCYVVFVKLIYLVNKKFNLPNWYMYYLEGDSQ